MKHMVGYQHLDCFQLAVAVNHWIANAPFPRGRSNLRNQAVRAADSVVLNLAEGLVGQGKVRQNHLRIAFGSVSKCHAALELAALNGGQEPQQRLRRVAHMIQGLLK